MGRKFNKKISKKALLQGLAIFFFSAVTTTMLFQNCSQVSVSDMTIAGKEEQARILRIGAGEVLVEVGASHYEKTEVDFNVGLNDVPSLRQMWIVDNSGTMEANNLNLSTSFGAMFDQSNKDSLFKFDTTAYLFNTGQTVPSFVTASDVDKAVLTDVANRQKLYFDLNNVISESVFDGVLRTSTQNSGQIPGDNVGIEVRRSAAGVNDFSVLAAPVLSKVLVGPSVQLTAAINKPANTNTTSFEAEFKNKLSVLKSARVPTSLEGQYYVQQSAKIIDKESGLCAVARILENPNGMYSSSDLLAFTIVTDENEHDVSGKNCIKRTAKTQDNVLLVSGKCSQFETAFSYTVTNTVPGATTCTVTGKKGYEAKFAYNEYSMDISYRGIDKVGGTTYSTPRTRITYTTPKFKSQVRQTPVSYYVQSCTTASYEYRTRRTPVSYYTQTCTTAMSDGIPKTTCLADAGVAKTGTVYGDQRSNCAASVISLNGKAITATSEFIGADKLPNCNNTPVWSTWGAASCTVSDTANCERRTVDSVCTVSGGVRNEWITGDYTSKCNDAARALNVNAIIATSANIGADKLPNCALQPIKWNDTATACNASDSLNCNNAVPNGFKTDNYVDVPGTIVNGTSACTTHASLPTNATSPTCAASPLGPLTGAGSCPTAHADKGCVPTTTVDTFKTHSRLAVAGIKDAAACRTWAYAQTSTQRIRNDADITCGALVTIPKDVRSNLLFAQTLDGSTTIGIGESCGTSRTKFFDALSTSDKNKLSADVNAPCTISKHNDGSVSGYALTGASCTAQLSANCDSAKLRSCSPTTVTAGASQVAGSPQSLGKINMKATCDSLCKDVFSGFCAGATDQNISIRTHLTNTHGGTGKTVACSAGTPVESAVVETITSRPDSQKTTFCKVSDQGVPSYFVQNGNSYYSNTSVDEFVTGTKVDELGKLVPVKDLISYIKEKAALLNVNFTVFVRKPGEEGVQPPNGPQIDYIGTQYINLADQTGGQVYSVTASSYADALKNLSSVIKSKLIRSFTINAMQPHQIITSVKIVRTGGTQTLANNQWSQVGKTITIANVVPFDEGDKIVVQFQNNDGYIKAQLKNIFVIDEMRPDQIVLSVEHIKASGETVLLRTDQWLKEDNTIKIDPALDIFGGDQFRIKFKNNTTEE